MVFDQNPKGVPLRKYLKSRFLIKIQRWCGPGSVRFPRSSILDPTAPCELSAMHGLQSVGGGARVPRTRAHQIRTAQSCKSSVQYLLHSATASRYTGRSAFTGSGSQFEVVPTVDALEAPSTHSASRGGTAPNPALGPSRRWHGPSAQNAPRGWSTLGEWRRHNLRAARGPQRNDMRLPPNGPREAAYNTVHYGRRESHDGPRHGSSGTPLCTARWSTTCPRACVDVGMPRWVREAGDKYADRVPDRRSKKHRF